MVFRRILYIRALLIFAAGLLLSGMPARAQTNIGSISGIVSDPSGASAPKCQITATSQQTGLKQSVRTQESGFYTFAGLPTGTYSLVARSLDFTAAIYRESCWMLPRIEV